MVHTPSTPGSATACHRDPLALRPHQRQRQVRYSPEFRLHQAPATDNIFAHLARTEPQEIDHGQDSVAGKFLGGSAADLPDVAHAEMVIECSPVGFVPEIADPVAFEFGLRDPVGELGDGPGRPSGPTARAVSGRGSKPAPRDPSRAARPSADRPGCVPPGAATLSGRAVYAGIADPALLHATHIVPWAECAIDAARMDVHNGLLPSALLRYRPSQLRC